MEPFPEFLTHVTNAFEGYVPSGHAKDIIIKQLTLEGLNTVTHNSIVPVRNEDIHKWVLAAHDIDTQNRPISAPMASINLLVNAKLGKNENFVLPVHTYWRCAESGHLHRDCPRAHPKTNCPKYQKGYYWA